MKEWFSKPLVHIQKEYKELKSNLAKTLDRWCTYLKKVQLFFFKICLKVQDCVAIVMHDKWMKEWFSKP